MAARKGQAEMLEWFPRLIMLLVAVIVIVMLVRYFAYREVDASELHRASYANRLYYDILAYRDPATGRAYPGVVPKQLPDIDAIYGKTGKISSMITLSGPCIATTSVYHDEATYDRYLGFARFGTLGPGGATVEENIIPVTIHGGCAGMLNITIVRPNA